MSCFTQTQFSWYKWKCSYDTPVVSQALLLTGKCKVYFRSWKFTLVVSRKICLNQQKSIRSVYLAHCFTHHETREIFVYTKGFVNGITNWIAPKLIRYAKYLPSCFIHFLGSQHWYWWQWSVFWNFKRAGYIFTGFFWKIWADKQKVNN